MQDFQPFVKTKYFMFSFLFKDELTGILKKLSLEKYQPIFEEQEVQFCFNICFAVYFLYESEWNMDCMQSLRAKLHIMIHTSLGLVCLCF